MSESGRPRVPSSGGPRLPEITLELTARTFYKQAQGYGFALGDFIRFTSILLRIAMARRGNASEPLLAGPPPLQSPHTALPLVGEQVKIRGFDAYRDRPLLERWVEDPDGRLFLLSPASGSGHDIDLFIANSHNLIGTILHNDRPIGCVAYLDYCATQRRAELRRLIGEADLRELGLAHEAVALWVGYGLDALGLRKIYQYTLATHDQDIKLNEDLGFRIEGILRHELLIEDEYHDLLRMGLCRDCVRPK